MISCRPSRAWSFKDNGTPELRQAGVLFCKFAILLNMPRRPLSIPAIIKDLQAVRNRPGYYSITRAGITYTMPLEQTRELKQYWRGYVSPERDRRSMQDWYSHLPNEIKKLVERAGDVPDVDDGFYPDLEAAE